MGEEHDDDDREAAKSEPVELEVAEAGSIDDMRAEQESAEQLPDALVEQFHTAVMRAGRARKNRESRWRPTNKCSTFLTLRQSPGARRKKKQKKAK